MNQTNTIINPQNLYNYFKLNKKTQLINSNPSKNNNTQQFSQTLNTSFALNQNSFKIASLNTRGLNVPTKLASLINYISDNNYSIFGVSETKFNNSITLPKKLDKYISYWSSTNLSQAGVGIFIHQNLTNHIYKTISHEGYVISIFLQFKPKIKICITQIYIPHHSLLKRKTISYLINLIKNNNQNNISHIIMGDFNATSNPLLD